MILLVDVVAFLCIESYIPKNCLSFFGGYENHHEITPLAQGATKGGRVTLLLIKTPPWPSVTVARDTVSHGSRDPGT